MPDRRTTKWLMIVAAIGLALAAIAYGVGRLQTAQRLEAAHERIDGLEQRLLRIHQLEARRHLDLALAALDQRNYGIAEKHLVSATRRLKKSKPGPDSELATLTKRIGETNLVPAAEFSEQRKQVHQFIERFDELVPPEPQASGNRGSR
jgi:hypothetical protein